MVNIQKKHSVKVKLTVSHIKFMASLYREIFFYYINNYLGWYWSFNIPYNSLLYLLQLQQGFHFVCVCVGGGCVWCVCWCVCLLGVLVGVVLPGSGIHEHIQEWYISIRNLEIFRCWYHQKISGNGNCLNYSMCFCSCFQPIKTCHVDTPSQIKKQQKISKYINM